MYDGCSSSLGMWRSHRLHIEFCTHKFPCAAAALFFQLSPFLGPRVCTACFVMNYTWIEQTGLRVFFVGNHCSRRFQCLVFFQCSGQIVFCLKVINMQTKVFDALCEWIRSCSSMHFSCSFLLVWILARPITRWTHYHHSFPKQRWWPKDLSQSRCMMAALYQALTTNC